MSVNNFNTADMQQLIAKFHPDIIFQPSELKKMEECLFTGSDSFLLFLQPEVELTVSYLREIVVENRIKSVSELLTYYATMEAEITHDIVNTAVVKTTDEQSLESSPTLRSLFSVQTPGKRWKDNNRKLALHFADFVHDYTKKQPGTTSHLSPGLPHNRLFATDNNRSEPICTKPARLFSKAYLEQFSSHDDAVFILYDDNSNKRKIETCRTADLPLAHERNEWDEESGISRTFNKVLLESLESRYYEVIVRISTEEPILSEDIKLKLTEWLYFLKLRVLDTKGCLQASYDQLFLYFKQTHIHKNSVELLDVCTTILREYAAKIYRSALANKQWVILKSPVGNSWLTSDNPGFSIALQEMAPVSPRRQPDSMLTKIEGNMVIYFPLSKKYCLKLKPSNNKKGIIEPSSTPIRFEDVTLNEFNTINRLTLATDKDMIISANKRTLEEYDTEQAW
jgi:uncharacterized phage-like protein YoqJ